MLEIVRLEVEAVPAYMVPLAVSAVVEAKVMVPLVAVREPSVAVPIVAEFEKRLVLDAVVVKNVVEVAFARVTAPVKEFAPEKVLMLDRSVVDAPRAESVDS
jgi:hypothetical protein